MKCFILTSFKGNHLYFHSELARYETSFNCHLKENPEFETKHIVKRKTIDFQLKVSSWLLAREQEPPSKGLKSLFCPHIQGNADSAAAPAARGTTAVRIPLQHADFTDASVSEKRLNTTGKSHKAITKAGHRNKPKFRVINSSLSGCTQMLRGYTLLPFILLNPNLTLRFPFAVHIKRHVGAIFPASSVLGGIPYMWYMFDKNNTWAQLHPHAKRAAASATGRARTRQPARSKNTGGTPRSPPETKL